MCEFRQAILLKFIYVKNRQLKRLLEHSIYLIILLVLIPSFMYFELCVVLPVVVEEWTLKHLMHLFCATFLLFNIIGNMLYGMFTNTSIKGRLFEGHKKDDWTMCDVCECLRPPRAWHCTTCDVCILKRDHHCTFFACCVGYFNHRYFIYFTFYIFIAMVYSFYYNVQFLSLFITWNHGFVLIKFLLPLASFVIDFGDESLYVFLVVMNVIVGLFSGFLFIYHFNNILKGRLVPEISSYSENFVHNKGWKLNLIEVLGHRWYLTWISPFIHSPLQGNGYIWTDDNKSK
ncbi:probable palmitoyltransferase ZDHHC24 [Manduca sexta]|uniref:probable palmitoyltransferase ZDHHC24 n=1 Tax=Manduca sexta TaxID=7130 RepID=UPI0011838975|nr:probable palmitoyltransferase ZDHHC24 [Manduca sexta]